MKRRIITNNPMVKEKYGEAAEFVDCYGYRGVLVRARDLIHDGWCLETHPLTGSVKPNETPYKSILMHNKGVFDESSLLMIENSIERIDLFMENRKLPDWPAKVLLDFQVIDMDLMGLIPVDLEGYDGKSL